jgi:hypothetical protein
MLAKTLLPQRSCALLFCLPRVRRFWIDAGNGHVTILPSILFALGMTWDVLPPRILGAMGMAFFWQMMYGEF